MDTGADAGIVGAWVDGWTLSRGAAPAVEESWGFVIDVGLPRQVTRHVLPHTDEALFRRLLEKTGAPGTWIKTCATEESLAPWLTPGWIFDAPGWLMTSRLCPSPPQDVPAGYRLRSWSRAGVTRVLVLAPDGAFAARGQIAGPCRGESVVFDQIETSPGHRRRGLGRAVMGALANAAAADGARTGVLGATVDGRALYASLGWSVHAPLTGVILTSPGVDGG